LVALREVRKKGDNMSSDSASNFVRQQGFRGASQDSCSAHFAALSFQPRMTAPLVLLGIVFQSAGVFLVLSAINWWNVLVPRFNVFDIIYNRVLAVREGAARLTPAPAPRRFSMGMAASFMLGTGVSIAAGWTVAAIVLQAFLVVALSAILVGRLCLGSYIYHLVTGQVEFANRTLPWSRGVASEEETCT
jgi:hypothetical protein